jgi:chromosome segregation ATPase
MSVRNDDQDIKNLEKEVEQLRAEERQVRKGWSELEGRDPNNPNLGHYKAEAEHLERVRSEAEEKLARAIMEQAMQKNSQERDEPERSRGGRGR